MMTKDSPAVDKVILKCIEMAPTTANKLQVATGYALNTVNIALREGMIQKRIHVCGYVPKKNTHERVYMSGKGVNKKPPPACKLSRMLPVKKKPAPKIIEQVTKPVERHVWCGIPL